MRSATAPATSATVITAKVSWYIMNKTSGIVFANGLTEPIVMPERKKPRKAPINASSPVKERL